MPQVLRLEYACTAAEKREAEELNIRHRIARGSKWKTNVILGAALVGALFLMYLRVAHDALVARRPYVFGGLVLLILVVIVWRQRPRRNPSGVTNLEISDTELRIHSSGGNVSMPWSCFSKCLESPNLFVLVDRPKVLLLVLPKRVFPDEKWQSWFRHQADNRTGTNEALVAEAPSLTQIAPADRIVLRFQLRFRDYLDRTIASWRTWAIVLGVMAVMEGCFLYATAHPPPRAVYSPMQVFFMFVLPIQCIMVVIFILISSSYTWYVYRNYPQEVALSEEGIALASRDEHSELKWTASLRFKETRRSFIIWTSPGPAWLMLPKRAFSSPDDLRRCTVLLTSHLPRSRWFFG